MHLIKILTIAGSDSSGGAGIQADIKTIASHGMYAMSAITALTAQNTTGVYAISEAAPEFVGQQMDAVFTDIYPDAVKVGMVSNVGIIKIIAEKLKFYNAANIVVDPVMVSASGGKLLSDNTCGALAAELFPLARVITPNIPECEELCGFQVCGEDDMLRAAREIGRIYPCAVLIKGGHKLGGKKNDINNHNNHYNFNNHNNHNINIDNCDDSYANDLLYDGGNIRWYRSRRINNPNTHGTGCTLSSAIACRLAEGKTLEDSVFLAKEYLTGAIGAMLDLGAGTGPLDHMYKMPRP